MVHPAAVTELAPPDVPPSELPPAPPPLDAALYVLPGGHRRTRAEERPLGTLPRLRPHAWRLLRHYAFSSHAATAFAHLVSSYPHSELPPPQRLAAFADVPPASSLLDAARASYASGLGRQVRWWLPGPGARFEHLVLAAAYLGPCAVRLPACAALDWADYDLPVTKVRNPPLVSLPPSHLLPPPEAPAYAGLLRAVHLFPRFPASLRDVEERSYVLVRLGHPDGAAFGRHGDVALSLSDLRRLAAWPGFEAVCEDLRLPTAPP